MEELENTPTPPPPKTCRAGKSLCVWLVLGVALLTGLGYVAVLHYPQRGILVPVERKDSRIDLLEERLDMIEKRLEEGTSALPQAPVSIVPPGEVSQKPAAQTENKDVKNYQAAQDFIAAAFSFWDLREAAKTGRAFALQYAALRAASANDAKLSELVAKLEPHASGKTPTLVQLREALVMEEKAAPPPVPAETSSFMARVKSVFRSMISIRPLHDPRFVALEKALDDGDAVAALEAVKALPEEVRKNIGAWQANLEARIALDDVLQTLTVYFTTVSSKESAP